MENKIKLPNSWDEIEQFANNKSTNNASVFSEYLLKRFNCFKNTTPNNKKQST